MTNPVEYPWPYEWVPETPSRFELTLNSLYNTNPFRAARRQLGPIVIQWKGSFTFSSDKAWYRKAALMARLKGGENYLRLFDPQRCYPRGVAAGLNFTTVKTIKASAGESFSDGTMFSDGTGWSDASGYGALASAAMSGGDTLVIAGLIASQATSFAAGDLLELGGYLYEVSNDAPSDVDGKAQVVICPPLRKSALVGDPVKFDHPTSPFQVVQEQDPITDRQAANLGSFGFSFVEVVPEI